ncbi:MAG: RrF2 family transcriptional regulator, partial [Armatimonadota bacterium]
MKVSTRAEYGMRALLDLVAHYGEGPVHSRTIARRQGLPEPYLNQLMTMLRRAGLVSSKRGPAGGHALSRPPGEISLREAFGVLEGTTSPWWCVEVDDPDCVYLSGCGLRPVWQAIQAATDGVLNRLTLADFRPTGRRPTAQGSGPRVSIAGSADEPKRAATLRRPSARRGS